MPNFATIFYRIILIKICKHLNSIFFCSEFCFLKTKKSSFNNVLLYLVKCNTNWFRFRTFWSSIIYSPKWAFILAISKVYVINYGICIIVFIELNQFLFKIVFFSINKTSNSHLEYILINIYLCIQISRLSFRISPFME